MFLEILEDIQNLWNTISPYLAGITIGGIVSCFFYAFFSAGIKKWINKIQIGDMVEKTVDESMERIKDLSINVQLQPLVNEALQDITKQVIETNKKAYEDVMNKVNNLIECFGKLATYFDNSIAVPQEVKDDLHNAIDNAKQLGIEAPKEEIIVKPLIEDTKKQKKQATTNVR